MHEKAIVKVRLKNRENFLYSSMTGAEWLLLVSFSMRSMVSAEEYYRAPCSESRGA